ncbi:VanZ family protein [Halopenitus persicus]|uniref:VanZ like family protein n=1 Tax=Halopenitus persicus TaxID=1048396 RepID=A0A1H3IXK8_9EURY|nr:VanZ family protein [Halopenitus persicus]SDY32431.1 VanZ like family protein [Halopenitus persicus]
MTRRRLRLPLLPRRLRLGVVTLVAGVILYYSVFAPPGSGTIEMGPFGIIPYSTWLHFLAYVGLGGWVGYALSDRSTSIRRRTLATFLTTWGYGVAIEVVQWPLPERTFALTDMGVNALGALVAAIVWIGLLRIARFYRLSSLDDVEPVVG